METIVGFVAGYLVGVREGRDGLERLRSSWHAIRTSPEARKLAGEAVTLAGATLRRASAGRQGLDIKTLGGAVSSATEVLARRAAAARAARAA
jgi:hypothetical protein